jgi:hypothetical protein
VATVTVLTAARIDVGRLQRRLARAGYDTVADADSLRICRPDRRMPVDARVSDPSELPPDILDSARRLLGRRPRWRLTCSFDGPAHTSEAWGTVVDTACAVAANVPLAVLDDLAGAVYLVHPNRGLVRPQDAAEGGRSASDVLRRLLGDKT